MKILSIFVISTSLIITGCAGNSFLSKKYQDLATKHQLSERSDTLFDLVLIKADNPPPNARSIYVAPLNLENVEIDESYKSYRVLPEEWQLTPDDISEMQDMFAKAISHSFTEESGFILSETPQLADLIITPRLSKIAPNAPKDDLKSRAPGVKYYTEGSGRMTITISVKQADELVMQIEDSRTAGWMWERNTRFSNRQNVRNLFSTWAYNLLETLQH